MPETPQSTTDPSSVPPPISHEQTAPVAPSVTPPAPTQPKRIPLFVKILGLVLAGVAVLAVVIYFGVTSATKAPQQVSDKFVNFIQAKDTSGAYQQTNSAFRESASESDLDAVIQQVAPVLQGEEKIVKRSIEKNAGSATTAVFVYSLTGSDGKTYYIKTVLQKDDETWKVLNFRSSEDSLDTTVE